MQIVFYSVKGRAPTYNVPPLLRSAESPGPKAEKCFRVAHTWNTHHSRAVHTSLHQILHMEELEPLIIIIEVISHLDLDTVI